MPESFNRASISLKKYGFPLKQAEMTDSNHPLSGCRWIRFIGYGKIMYDQFLF